MNWPSGGEWAIGEFVVLGFLLWELYHLRQIQRRDRKKAQQKELRTRSQADATRCDNKHGDTPPHGP